MGVYKNKGMSHTERMMTSCTREHNRKFVVVVAQKGLWIQYEAAMVMEIIWGLNMVGEKRIFRT